MKFLTCLLLILLVPSAFAKNIFTCPPDLIASKSTDYGSEKAMIIAREGTYVCRNGYSLYITGNDQDENLYKLRDGARVIASDKIKLIPVCVMIK